MKTELIQPASTIVAALLASEADRLLSGHRLSVQEMFVATYRKLECALDQIEREDVANTEQRRMRPADCAVA